ncbi:MAG: 4-hydroxy-3-methylbut-2-enyl diphosphate reductase, partial [Candidatus Omnitrophica bacterium]|nr:4-hydroxy-3-methylbut-2-enyl diphosphate reductase [Candidatus Omnitrophota bacterium]
ARRLGYEIVDATCPMVKEIHRIAQDMEKKGYQIIVIGDREHDEVRGIIGHLKGRAIIIESPKRIPIYMLKAIKKAAVVVQSTQVLDEVLKIVEILKVYIAELKFFNTICKPTTLRQEEIKIMPLENEVMIIIGSRHSANTRRLYEISKSLNKRSYRVNAKKDIRRDWFAGAKTIGVTAGASTPDATTYDIIRYLKQNKLKAHPVPAQSHPADE